jgi:SAM-dependent methyltransferase
MRTKGNERPESWDKIYREGKPGWDIGKAAPPFEDLIATSASWLTPGKMASFGCGGGHDAHFFQEHGFDLTAFDFASEAITLANRNYPELKVLQKNILDLGDQYRLSFDYVLEHTCYCAIPVEHRRLYMESAHSVLKPNGILFGLFYRFDPADTDGPPYSLSLEQLSESFDKLFSLEEIYIPKKSHGRRKQRERFVVLKKIG